MRSIFYIQINKAFSWARFLGNRDAEGLGPAEEKEKEGRTQLEKTMLAKK